MRALVFVYFAAFLLEGLVALAGGGASSGEGRRILGWVMVGFGVLVFWLAAFLPALPKWRLLPAIGWSIWVTVCGGFPLAFVVPESAEAWLAWGQVLLGASLLGVALTVRRWPPAPAREFSVRNFVAMSAVAVVALPLVLVVAGMNLAGTELERVTAGYVKLRPEGLMIEEREFEREGRRVRLVGMMHIGDADFYRGVRESVPEGRNAVVLLEGVTDEDGLLRSRFSYANIARLLGVTPQETAELQRDGAARRGQDRRAGDITYRHADVDIRAFQPATIEFLNAVGRLLTSATFAAAWDVLREPDSPFQRPGAEVAMEEDLLGLRNEHLAGEIETALPEHPLVIVPWGAMHLPFVEDYLVERGFREVRREGRPVIRWRGPPAENAGR